MEEIIIKSEPKDERENYDNIMSVDIKVEEEDPFLQENTSEIEIDNLLNSDIKVEVFPFLQDNDSLEGMDGVLKENDINVEDLVGTEGKEKRKTSDIKGQPKVKLAKTKHKLDFNEKKVINREQPNGERESEFSCNESDIEVGEDSNDSDYIPSEVKKQAKRERKKKKHRRSPDSKRGGNHESDGSDQDYLPSQREEDQRIRYLRGGDYLASDSEDENSSYNYSASDDELDDPPGGVGLVGAEGPNDPNAQPINTQGFYPVTHKNDQPHELPEFTEAPVGPRLDFSGLTPIEIFKKFVDSVLVAHIIACTNANARFTIDDVAREKRIAINKVTFNGAKWKDLTGSEFYLYLAIHFYMGVSKEPKLSDYWLTHPIFGHHEAIRSAMSRSRFRNITKMLRFALMTERNQKFTAEERLSVFFKLLQERCTKNIHPGLHISVDEALVLFKGQLWFNKQFIKLKRSRFGIKIFFSCPGDPTWQGYSYKFSAYFGKNSDLRVSCVTEPEAASVGKSGRVVLHLMDGMLGQGRHVIVDNWYTSQVLGKLLFTYKTMLTGTIKANRGIPAVLREEAVPEDRASFMRRGEEVVCKFQDQKTVHAYSTRYGAGMVCAPKTITGGQHGHQMKPDLIQQYNRHMGGVNKADQYMRPYLPDRKSLVWFKKLGLHMLCRMALNSYIVWKNDTVRRNLHTEYLAFLKQLINDLLTTHSEPVARIMTLHRQTHRQQPPPKAPTREAYHRRQHQKLITAASLPRHPAPRNHGPPSPQRVTSHAPPVTSPAPSVTSPAPSVTSPAASVTSPAPSVASPEPRSASPEPPMYMYHQIAKLPPTEKVQHPQKRCKVHYDKYKTFAEAHANNWKKRKMTPYHCPLCEGQPGLCIGTCYDEYHKAHGFPTYLVVQSARRTQFRSPTASPTPSKSSVTSRKRSS